MAEEEEEEDVTDATTYEEDSIERLAILTFTLMTTTMTTGE